MSEIIKRIKYVKLKDYLSGMQFLLALPISFFLKWKRPHIWLVCEDKNEARDNGYCFFKYLRKEHPEIDAVYAINKQSPDYDKVRGLGEVISYGTFAHWIYYLAAEYNISSQKGGKPNAAICYFLEIYGLWHNKRIFLQHGVTVNDAKWLYYDVSKFSMFICGVKPEYEYIKNKFGYPKNSVVYTGMARWDDLHSCQVEKNRIIIMPSWREWLTDSVRSYGDNSEIGRKFTESKYYIKWKEFINDEKLAGVAEEYGLEIYFYPHRKMQKFIKDFHSNSKYVKVVGWKDNDIRELLKTSKVMITDYSSVFFDFIYMKKNVIFYQFDVDEFRKYQYDKGWFDYEKNIAGYCSELKDDIIEHLIRMVNDDFEIDSNLHKNMFRLYDDSNCDRIFKAIIQMH